jgi:hypothetical protein
MFGSCQRLRPLVATHLPNLRLILHSKYAVEPVTGCAPTVRSTLHSCAGRSTRMDWTRARRSPARGDRRRAARAPRAGQAKAHPGAPPQRSAVHHDGARARSALHDAIAALYRQAQLACRRSRVPTMCSATCNWCRRGLASRCCPTPLARCCRPASSSSRWRMTPSRPSRSFSGGKPETVSAHSRVRRSRPPVDVAQERRPTSYRAAEKVLAVPTFAR